MRHLPLLLALILATPLAAQSLGETTFPNSGAEAAQPDFLRGLLLLHSFEYDDARAAFQEAQRLDPDFAMAYWGEAMTHNHPIWMEQDRDAALDALVRLAPTPEARLAKAGTERERAYLSTLDVLYGDGDKEDRDDAYAEAMAALAAHYPDDQNAATFYALALLGTAHEGRDFSIYMRAAAVAEEVFDANPRHPGAAHYLIHAYDDPVHAPLGLRPARVYSEIAPDASHALHMPSHIYVALGQWDEAADLNTRSYEAARARTEARGEPLNGHGWHALYWRHYTELQRGRFEEARRLLDLARSMDAEHPSGRTRHHLLAMRAAHLVETGDWDGDVARWELSTEETSPSSRVRDRFVVGLAALRRGDRDAALAVQSDIADILADVNDPDPTAQAHARMLAGLLHLDAGDAEAGLAALREAVTIEDAQPFDFGPPNPVKPTHELLGDVLLDLGRAEEATTHYERALARAPRRVNALIGLAKAQDTAGDGAAASMWAEVAAIRHAADEAVREETEHRLGGSH